MNKNLKDNVEKLVDDYVSSEYENQWYYRRRFSDFANDLFWLFEKNKSGDNDDI